MMLSFNSMIWTRALFRYRLIVTTRYKQPARNVVRMSIAQIATKKWSYSSSSVLPTMLHSSFDGS